MIVCPNCNHQNPEGSTQCENCYTVLPLTTSCPNCGATVQSDATFCGQCGYNLQAENLNTMESFPEIMMEMPDITDIDVPTEEELLPKTPISMSSPWDDPEEELAMTPSTFSSEEASSWQNNDTDFMPEEKSSSMSFGVWDNGEDEQAEVIQGTSTGKNTTSSESLNSPINQPLPLEPQPEPEPKPPQIRPMAEQKPSPPPSYPLGSAMSSATQLQIQTASLLHVQTNTKIDIPQDLAVIHMGKTNSQIPPDVDVSGFPNSEIVSRIHADIRVEGDTYFIEDVGSSNGTYINHTPLLTGNRHRLRPGDRIALGKGDLVTFIFQLS